MIALIRSEVRKAFSTKLLLALVISAFGFVLLSVVLGVYLTPSPPGAEDTNALLDPANVNNIIASTGSASVFILLLGIMAMTSEYRNQTITSTFLASPHRSRVIIAKMITYSLFALILTIALWVTVMIVASILLSTVESAPLDFAVALEILGGALLGLVIYAILGVAIGSLITNQVVAVVGALVWIFVVEALLTVFVDSLGKWLPGGALNTILQASNTSGFGGTDVLSVPAAAAVLIGYTIIVAIPAAVVTSRRDIT